MKTRKIRINKEFIRASFLPKSYNEDDRTVEVVWTTGAGVKRYSWDGEFIEELSMKKSHIKLDRMNGGAPVLDNHDRYSGVRGVLGTVVKNSVRFETDKDGERMALCTIKFSARADVQDIMQDVRDGILSNISVGYVVNKFEERKEKIDGLPVLRAVDWEPYEVSLVAVPADAKAKVRSEEKDSSIEAVIIEENKEGEAMKKKHNAERSADDVKPEDVETTEADEQESTEEEAQDEQEVNEESEAAADDETETEEQEDDESGDDSEEDEDGEEDSSEDEEGERSLGQDQELKTRQLKERNEAIVKACETVKLERSFADELCKDEKITIEKARSLIFEELEKKTKDDTRNQRVEVLDVEQSKLRKEAMVRTLLHRANPTKHKLEKGDNELMRHSLIESARAYMKAEGKSGLDSLDNFEIAKRALHSTSDFIEILKDSANKSLRDAYMGAPNTFAPFVRTRAAKDFKELTSIMLGNGGTLQKVNEHGEYPRTTLDESAEKYKVEKFGLIIGKTYELMVNDDLDAFSEIPRKLGMRAREKENEIFWGLIIANAVMAETGEAMFSAAHGNIADSNGSTPAVGAPSVTTLAAARESMRLQRDLDGELMRTIGRHLVVPASLELAADQILTQTTPNENAQVNPFSNSMSKVVEPRLDAASKTAWYVFGSAAESPIGEMATLGGRGPEIFQKEGFDVDGLEIKIRHHFGMKIVDFRNIYKNVGA